MDDSIRPEEIAGLRIYDCAEQLIREGFSSTDVCAAFIGNALHMIMHANNLDQNAAVIFLMAELVGSANDGEGASIDSRPKGPVEVVNIADFQRTDEPA